MKKTQEYVDIIWDGKEDVPRAIVLQNGHTVFLKVTKMRKDDVSQLLTDLLEKEEKISNEQVTKKVDINTRPNRENGKEGVETEQL